MGRDVIEWDAAWLSGITEGMSCEAVKPFLYRMSYLASRLVQEEGMEKTNVRDKISQRKYFLARLSKQCLQVYAEHSGQL